MIGKIIKALDNFERNIRNSFGKNISTKSGRFWANVHFQLMDHAFIRIFWNNFHEISEGVYRANQPSPSHLKSYKKLGIKSVLSLRGRANQSYDLFEDEYCKRLGLNLIYTPISSGSAPMPEDLLKIIQVLRELPKPVVLHCKSGADRAGIMCALYFLLQKKPEIQKAKQQLSWKYLHIKWAKPGVLDAFVHEYINEYKKNKIKLLDWVSKKYEPLKLEKNFRSIWWVNRLVDDILKRE